MKIVVLSPWTDPTGEFAKLFGGLLAGEVDMTGVELAAIDAMPEAVMYRPDMSPAAGGLESIPFIIPEVMKKAKALEKTGANAIVNACVLGLGSPQAAQVVDIPVLDPGEVAMHLASLLGQQFSLLVPGMAAVRGFEENVTRYGMGNRLASILSTDINPASYAVKEKETMDVLLRLSLKAIEEDKATVIILGCGMLTGKGRALKKLLLEKGHDVAVLQPIPLALEMARVLVRLELKQVRLVPFTYNYRL